MSQKQDVIEVKIATWYKDKAGAISISFDDASYSQYTAAYPVLEKEGIKATFGIVGEWIEDEPAYKAETGFFDIKRMGWNQMIELSQHGHELASHGYLHEKYNKQLAISDLAVEMKKNKDLIESKTSTHVFTLQYPYSFASGNIPLASEEAGFFFGRTGLDTVNSSSPPRMYLLASQCILNEFNPDAVAFQKWIGEAKGNWLILMYHHLFEPDSKEMQISRAHNVDYSYSVSPAHFENQIGLVAESGYWVAPISTIGKYITERDNTTVRAIRTRDKIIIYSITNLDIEIYDQPLTIKVEVPWKKVSIQGSLNDGVTENNSGILMIDVLPEKEIIIQKQ